MPKEVPFEELVKALLDEGKPFQARYLYRLSDLNSDDALRLEEAWPRISLRRRLAVMEDLYDLCQNDTLLSFEEIGRVAVRDSEPGVRALAVRVLSEFEDEANLPLFLDLAQKDADAEVRAAAAAALGYYIYLGEVDELSASAWHAVEEALLQIIEGDEAEVVRRRALESLGFSSRREVPALIEKAYHSGDADWLAAALNAMGRSANRRWSRQVMAMLNHLRPAVRAEAACAAGELEIRAARPRLLEMLSDDNRDVCMAAIWSLSQIGGKGVRARLEEMLEHSEDSDEIALLESALDNLAFTEDTGGLVLLDIHESEDEDDRAYYAEGDLEEEEEANAWDEEEGEEQV